MTREQQIRREIERLQAERHAIIEHRNEAERAWERAQRDYYADLQRTDREIAALHLLLEPHSTRPWRAPRGRAH